jgi:hypothetical protein
VAGNSSGQFLLFAGGNVDFATEQKTKEKHHWENPFDEPLDTPSVTVRWAQDGYGQKKQWAIVPAD